MPLARNSTVDRGDDDAERLQPDRPRRRTRLQPEPSTRDAAQSPARARPDIAVRREQTSRSPARPDHFTPALSKCSRSCGPPITSAKNFAPRRRPGEQSSETASKPETAGCPGGFPQRPEEPADALDQSFRLLNRESQTCVCVRGITLSHFRTASPASPEHDARQVMASARLATPRDAGIRFVSFDAQMKPGFFHWHA